MTKIPTPSELMEPQTAQKSRDNQRLDKLRKACGSKNFVDLSWRWQCLNEQTAWGCESDGKITGPKNVRRFASDVLSLAKVMRENGYEVCVVRCLHASATSQARAGWAVVMTAMEGDESKLLKYMTELEPLQGWWQVFTQPLGDEFFGNDAVELPVTQSVSYDELLNGQSFADYARGDSKESLPPVKASHESRNGWNEANQNAPENYPGEPLVGTKKDLVRWILNKKDSRILDNAIKNGTYWGRINSRCNYSVWFKTKKRFAEANSRRLADEH